MMDKELFKKVPCYEEPENKGKFTSEFYPSCESDGQILIHDMSCTNDQRKNCPLLHQIMNQKTR